MLTKVEITNFKNFNDTFIFDLTQTKSFEFNKECVKNGIVNKAIIYGHNGVGKSNLGLALFDLVSHITDKKFIPEKYTNYLNADSTQNSAKFKFEFLFDGNQVVYEYSKKSSSVLLDELCTINGKVFAKIVKQDNKNIFLETDAVGTEGLKKDMTGNNISIIKYIKSNTILENNNTNSTFNNFVNFIENMLLFRNLDDRFYIGYEQGRHELANDIVEKGHLEDFESFLNDAGVSCKLSQEKIDGSFQLYFSFKEKKINFFEIASSGTTALTIFYFWYQRLKSEKKCSFLFIDEFDAFYHHSLSRLIVQRLTEVYATQVILTTHNTSVISNELLRPDCYFLMYKDRIRSLSNSTVKELREAHNIEKMYRAGSFEY